MVKANPDGLTWRFKKLVAAIMVEPPQDAPGTETRATGRARSTVSTDLHGTEALSGIRFMATGAAGEGMKSRVARLTRSENATGRARRASILDWHALRVTWVTLALSAGVPMEVCRLVTGHKTVEIVLRHYFKPGREHLRAVLGDKLPSVLTGNGSPTPPALSAGDKLGAFVAELTPAERKRLVAMLAK